MRRPITGIAIAAPFAGLTPIRPDGFRGGTSTIIAGEIATGGIASEVRR